MKLIRTDPAQYYIVSNMLSELETMFRKSIPFYLMTDSKSLFDVIYRRSRITEKRMMLDVSALPGSIS